MQSPSESDDQIARNLLKRKKSGKGIDLMDDHDDEAVAALLLGNSVQHRVFLGVVPSVGDGGKVRRSSAWTLQEDLRLCGRVLDCGGADKRLSPAWFRTHFTPMPEELRERNIGALILRYNYLREEFLSNLAKQQAQERAEVSWEWLVQKHAHTQSKEYYTYEQDLALCQIVVTLGQVGRRVGQKWFRENVVGRLPVLEGRNASGLYGRYSKRLAKKLAQAMLFTRGNQGPSYQWLRELHGVEDAAAEAAEGHRMLTDGDLTMLEGPTAGAVVGGGSLVEPTEEVGVRTRRAGKRDKDVKVLDAFASRKRNKRDSGLMELSMALHPGSQQDEQAVWMALYGDAGEPLTFRITHAHQIEPALFSPCALGEAERMLLTTALQLALDGWAFKSSQLLWVVDVDLDALSLYSVLVEGRALALDAMDESKVRRVVRVGAAPHVGGAFSKKEKTEDEDERAVLSPHHVPISMDERPLLLSVTALAVQAWDARVPPILKAGRRGSPFSLEEDIALCERVVRTVQGAPRLQLQYFDEQVVEHVQELHGRPATSLMMRYNNHLQDGLTLALAAAHGGPVNYDWLRLRRDSITRPFSLEQHEAMSRLVLREEVVGQNLSEAWWMARMPQEVADRLPGAVTQEYQVHLLVPLQLAFRQANEDAESTSFQWLLDRHREAKHLTANRPYTFEEDYVLCRAILDSGMAGLAIPIQWFVQNVYQRHPELSSRSHASLESRYRVHLKTKVARAVRTAETHDRKISWAWLLKLHRIKTVDREKRFPYGHPALEPYSNGGVGDEGDEDDEEDEEDDEEEEEQDLGEEIV